MVHKALQGGSESHLVGDHIFIKYFVKPDEYQGFFPPDTTQLSASPTPAGCPPVQAGSDTNSTQCRVATGLRARCPQAPSHKHCVPRLLTLLGGYPQHQPQI